MIKRLRHFSIACLFAMGTVGLAPGATILSITGPLASSSGLGMTNFNSAQSAAGEAFALATGFTNLSIIVSLGVFEDEPVPLTAWVTNKIGPGTTAANVIATTTGTPLTSGPYTAFSGLSLGPGTYYLVLAAVQQFNNVGWDWTETQTVTTAPGVTFLGQFANPGNTNDSWNVLPPSYGDFGSLQFDNPFLTQISGDPAAVPEPQTIALTGMGMVVLLFHRSRRVS